MLEIPVFDSCDVQGALEALRQAVPLPGNSPLLLLYCARGYELTNQPLAELGVFQTLAGLIRQQLQRHRTAQTGTAPRMGTSIHDLQHDFQMANAELEAWSFLYFRYIRTELDLSMEKIARIVGQTTRNLQRRRQLAVRRLTQLVWRREQQTRRRWQYAVALSYLRITSSRRLYSRVLALDPVVPYVLTSTTLHSFILNRLLFGTDSYPALPTRYRPATGHQAALSVGASVVIMPKSIYP